MKFPLYTLILTAAIILLYFLMSAFSVYIPADRLLGYGFSMGNWLGLLSYTFVHVGLPHLIGNLVMLFVVGFIAEQKLRALDVFVVYFLSGTVAAVVFVSINPNTTLIGASAAISGLLCCAFFVDFKKAIIAVPVTLIVLSLLVSPYLAAAVQDVHSALYEQESGLQTDLNETIQEKNKTLEDLYDIEMTMAGLYQKFESGEINKTEYETLMSELVPEYVNKTEEVISITEKENQTASELINVIKEKGKIEQGQQREEEAKSPAIVHLAGFFTAFVYLAIVRRDILWTMTDSFPLLKLESKRTTKKASKQAKSRQRQ